MGAFLRALAVFITLLVVGLVGWRLSGGSKNAARDSARCLDPRQPGCASGGVNPTAGLTDSKGWSAGGSGPRPDSARPGGLSLEQFDVPRTQLSGGSLPSVSPSAAQASPEAAALHVVLSDLSRELPQGTTERRGPGPDADTSLVEYVSRGGEVLLRVLSGHDGVVATDYDKGVVYQLDRDGTLRHDGALSDPREAPRARSTRLTQRWGLDPAAAAHLGKSAGGTAAFIDLRRSGMEPQSAQRLAALAAAPMPSLSAWQKENVEELGGLDPSVIERYYSFLRDVPVLGRLVAGVLGEPPLAVAQRFGFDPSALRSFMEGATEADLLLGKHLQALPGRIHAGTPAERRTLRALVGDPAQAATLPLAVASLQRAMEQPEEVVRALSALPSGYPYLILAQPADAGRRLSDDRDRQRPLLVTAATILSWAAPLHPGEADALSRLQVLPADAPVAVQAPLPGEVAQAMGLPLAPGEIQLRAFAPAGPLRDLLEEDGALLSRLKRLFYEPQARPPATYFGHAPFVYASITARGGAGPGRVLGRRGIPTAALLHLSGAALDALPGTAPRDAGKRLHGALSELFAAHGRAAASVTRYGRELAYSAAGRQVLEKWEAVQAQLAMAGLASGCVTQQRCPLPGLTSTSDGLMLVTLLRRGIADLRPRVLLCPIAPAAAAQLADRMGELLLSADHVAAALSPGRRFAPTTRDPAALVRALSYIRAATGEDPRPDPGDERAYRVRDLPASSYRDHLSAFEKTGRLPAAEQLDAEVLRLRRDRGEVPATLGELVQRYGDALQAAKPAYLPAQGARARIDRRVRLRFRAGLRQMSLVQTMDRSNYLRDVEVMIELPSGELDGFSYDGDGRLVLDRSVVPLGGSGCLSCHHDRKGRPILGLPAGWQPGSGGPTWLTPVLSAELQRTAAVRRAMESQ